MTTLVFKNRPNELVTTTDGRKIWASRSVAVVMVAIAQILTGKNHAEIYVAIGKRGKAMPDKSGFWNLPCGYLDFAEAGYEAAKRESWEEIGLNVDEILNEKEVIFTHLDQPWHVKSEPDENRQNVTLRYGFFFKSIESLPKLIANNCCEENEVEEALWVNMKDLDKYEFAFGHDKVIKNYWNMLGEA